ncbi:MAG: Gfo/Idh/MocA family protein [Bacteroidota bacterium]
MKLRGALIGMGNIATRGHLPALLEDRDLMESVDIVAVMDVVETQREYIHQILPGARYYTNLETLLDQEKLDFVDICTPPFTHAGYIQTCAEKGLHIICEKPLTDGLQSAKEVASILKKSKIVFVPCHQYKYSPLWKAVHDCVKMNELGRVTFAQFNVFRLQADTGTAAWNPGWRTEKKQSGGGILVDTGAHYFYLIQFLFGLPVSLSCTLRTLNHPEYQVEDTAVVVLEYPGMLVQINLTWAASQRANSVYVAGTNGSLSYDGVSLLQTTNQGVKNIPMQNISDKKEYIRWYASLFKEFYRRVTEKDYSDDLLDEAVTVMDLLDQSYASNRMEIHSKQ